VKAAVYRGPDDVVLGEWPRPTPEVGELLLAVRACGLCGSDILKIAGAGKAPAVFGHEVVGDVVDVGPDVDGFAPGDRVVAAHHVPCFTCHYCARGSVSMCRTFKQSNLDPGGFAELVRVPRANVAHATFKVPSHVSDAAASFVEPLGCCLRAVRRAGFRVRSPSDGAGNLGSLASPAAAPRAADDTAVVVGLGSIGCLFVQLLRRAGAHVVGSDPLAERAALAGRLGADAFTEPKAAAARVGALSDGRGADLVMITAGGAAVLPWAVAVVRDGGAVHFFGGGAGALALPLEHLYHRELTVTATYSSSPADLADAHALIVAGAVVTEPLLTHRVPLGDVMRGVDLMRRREAVKVLVTP
jgi:L-iditol 2-dehydrogenase